jgi:hypothetical protein
MPDPIEIYRTEVAQRIQMANSQGGWEGTHTDFKREQGSTYRDLGKLVKHILAFANTPRRTDAYLIFGVTEDKDRAVFEHVGIPDGGFPSPERIYDIVHQHTKIRDLFVDAHLVLDGKRTPYIVIPLQYEGPYSLLQDFHGSLAREVFCRYGSSSARATERDVRRMQKDWATWFLDCRYEKSPTSLITLLSKRFPNHSTLVQLSDYVRLVYQSSIRDDFGTHIVTALVHAYWGFDRIEPDAVDRIRRDDSTPAFQKTIIGARFADATRAAAASATVYCIPLDEIYFVNDPYAQLCREFMRRWDSERSERYRGLIVDLDFRLSLTGQPEQARESILSFLEEQLQSPGRTAIVVHGGFGCGKTTTAKQLVAHMATEYLRGHPNVPRVLYVDVNNLDIRSRRDECIESQLLRYELSREHVDRIVAQVREDEIQLIFDGVDEMARPYTAGGRREAVDILKDVGNRRAAIYFVRSSYFPQMNDIITEFSLVADHDFATGRKLITAAEVLQLRNQQVGAYLESRLGNEDARKMRSTLHSFGFEAFLVDPLIVSLITDLVEREGVDSIGAFPHKGQRAHFLSYIVERLLRREQEKRQRHAGLAENFGLFQRVLRTVAFTMICRGSSTISPMQLESAVQRGVESAGRMGEVVDAFRTMSWVRRSEDGALTFRPEALTLICAAEHISAAFARLDALAVADWQDAAPLAAVVCEYAGEMITGAGVLGATAMLGSDVQFNVIQLIRGVLDAAKSRADLQEKVIVDLQGTLIGAVCQGALRELPVARLALNVLFSNLPPKRAVQVGVPLLLLLGRSDRPEAVNVALRILEALWNSAFSQRDFYDELRIIKDDTGALVDKVLLRGLKVLVSELLDGVEYENLFVRMHEVDGIEIRTKQYADRTLRAIAGEKQRRAAAFKSVSTLR